MEGDLDPFEFILAEALGMTVQAMRDSMPNGEYVKWQAFYTWRAAMREMHRKEPR